ncbi:MAG TPA: sigma factor-like helix-turn-helix DNA-binding protein [Actinomycetota bacterium]|nr:sigma factor-like helix-turn-helix DNA-binding protein [Actinomycetota bacterium]
MLASREEVIGSLVRYTDWWQPSTSSLLQVGWARRDTDVGDGIRRGLLETLDERAELCRRMRTMNETDRRILFLWYVKQLSAQDISKEVGISRRQCFRRRARAIRILLGEEVRERTVAPRSVAPR